jgi:hypothetical protein
MRSKAYVDRFRVEDLIPKDRQHLKAIFVGESPHRDEVAPEKASERSPFRGMAGRQWWTELARYLKVPVVANPVPPRKALLQICEELRFALMNAVQFPIDSKITLHQGEKSAPRVQLGFEKNAGPFAYKTIFKRNQDASSVQWALHDLASRLRPLENSPARLICLGNDSKWFVENSLHLLNPDAPLLQQPLTTIPHPSSWWRNASYRERAVKTLRELFG